jgi:hypothetical protein
MHLNRIGRPFEEPRRKMQPVRHLVAGPHAAKTAERFRVFLYRLQAGLAVGHLSVPRTGRPGQAIVPPTMQRAPSGLASMFQAPP